MSKQTVLVIAVVLVFGVFVPWYKGLDFLDPIMIIAYSCLGVLFAAPAGADALAPAEEPQSQESPRPGLLRTMATLIAYGWGITVLILAAGIGTVNAAHWRGRAIFPSGTLLLSSLLLGLTACFAVLGLSAFLLKHASPAGTKAILRTGFLVLLALLIFGSRFLPESIQSNIAAHMTTRGIIHFAFWSSAVLACLGALLTGLTVLRPAARA